jgi:hypothetical protein
MYIEIKELIGKTIIQIYVNSRKDRIIFECLDNSKYLMYHSNDCCEEVQIEDIEGDLNDLLGWPILQAEEINNYEPTNDKDLEKTKEANEYGTCTWTFYKLATNLGYVTIRWFGSSNGYYSESVEFEKID